MNRNSRYLFHNNNQEELDYILKSNINFLLKIKNYINIKNGNFPFDKIK